MTNESKPSWKRFHKVKINPKHLNRRAKKIETAGMKHAHTFIVKRWSNVYEVRRKMSVWLFLVALLIILTGVQLLWYQRSYTSDMPTAGGTYAEGVTGPLANMNPLFASTSAERSASRLIFASLFSYDNQNRLKGELASGYRIDKDGKEYTVTLRPNTFWHDGVPLTSEDVVFTINTLKNPEVGSPYASNWQGINVTAVDERTVRFTLPGEYSPFRHALTFGIVPKHILGDVPLEELREDDFGTQPVGSGPFSFRQLQSVSADSDRVIIYMNAYDKYVGGAPKLDRFQLHVYQDREQLQTAIISGEVNAVADLSSQDSKEIADMSKFRVTQIPIHNITYAFLKNDSEVLKDKSIRQALRLGTDTNAIRDKLSGFVRDAEGPVLSSQIAGVSNIKQPSFNQKKANEVLDKSGWKRGADGIRVKAGDTLSLRVVAIQSGDFPAVIEELSSQWKALGVEVQSELVPTDDVQQNVIRPRAYDVLLYELSLGADPDVYAYWHSSQITNGLNLSNYSSAVSDDALDSGRTTLEDNLRAPKYQAFFRQWLSDVPAIALYQPTLRYAVTMNTNIVNTTASINGDDGRYRNIEYWTVNKSPVFNTP